MVESNANRCGARAFTLDRVIQSKRCSSKFSFTLDQVVKSKHPCAAMVCVTLDHLMQVTRGGSGRGKLSTVNNSANVKEENGQKERASEKKR